MKKHCLACGIEKDDSIKEIYPYPEDDIVHDRPIDPFFKIDCGGSQDWRVVVVCHECFHKLAPDLWISENCWASLEPVTPFEELPKLQIS